LRQEVSGLGGPLIAGQSLSGILGHPLPMFMKLAQADVSIREAQVRRLSIESQSLDRVLGRVLVAPHEALGHPVETLGQSRALFRIVHLRTEARGYTSVACLIRPS